MVFSGKSRERKFYIMSTAQTKSALNLYLYARQKKDIALTDAMSFYFRSSFKEILVFYSPYIIIYFYTLDNMYLSFP